MKIISKLINILMYGGKTISQIAHERAEKAITLSISTNNKIMKELEERKEDLYKAIEQLQNDIQDIEDTEAVMERKQDRMKNAQKALKPIDEDSDNVTK